MAAQSGVVLNDDGSADAQELLEAEGIWHLVEEDDNAVDPLQQHMQARKQVDPSKLKSPHRYTSTPSAGDMDEDVHFRVLRLEKDVAELKTDFGKTAPEPPAEEQPEQDEQAKAAAASRIVTNAGTASAPPALLADGPSVTGLRIGEHSGKSRIVLDLSAPGAFTSAIDNTENTLVVDLPKTAWSAQEHSALAGHPLVKEYRASKSPSGGTTLTVVLKKSSRLVASAALGPNGPYGHRVFFDVAGL